MAHVSVAEVQHWLDPDKLEIPGNDPLPEDDEIAPTVLARIATAYDVSAWDTPSTTPAVVRKIIAMLVAANRYNKVYSETEDAGNRYANKLEGIAWNRVDWIVDGKLVLFDALDVLIADFARPKFYPDDNTGRSAIYNALGIKIGEEGSEERKFTMAMDF